MCRGLRSAVERADTAIMGAPAFGAVMAMESNGGGEAGEARQAGEPTRTEYGHTRSEHGRSQPAVRGPIRRAGMNAFGAGASNVVQPHFARDRAYR